MSDLIRRDDVLKALLGWETDPTDEEIEYTVNSIPAVEPKVGKWLDHSDEGYVECSFCGSLTTCEDNIDELHYCFNCGAKMERKADD